MNDMPYVPPSSNRAARDRIEVAINALVPMERWSTLGAYDNSEHQRRILAGLLRKAFMPELARMQSTEETLNRVRRLIRQFREDEAVPVRRLLAALYGDEKP